MRTLKTILLFVLMLVSTVLVTAAPISFQTEGSITQTSPNQYFLNLIDNFGANDRTAALIVSAPLESITMRIDTLPFQPGSGINVFLDSQQVLHTLPTVLVQQTYTFGLGGDTFTRIDFTTNWSPGMLERLTVKVKWVEEWEPPQGSVPEPGTLGLVAVGLGGMWWGRRRQGKQAE